MWKVEPSHKVGREESGEKGTYLWLKAGLPVVAMVAMVGVTTMGTGGGCKSGSSTTERNSWPGLANFSGSNTWDAV